ncbi:MAG TPA: EscU/YscU/HrcU family type III secretion system export apparatus switch protein [Pseudomonadales bacterium]|nr:EscU/YscU/HrcU family type III secretion system export apparatus switch protein [Pseudomonadales bacterium]
MSQNKENKAVALFYDGKTAPIVSAKGDSQVAQEIIRIARENNVPLYENEELVEVLARLELGDQIPEMLYRAIAEIIAFVYHLKGKVPNPPATGKGPPLLPKHKPDQAE